MLTQDTLKKMNRSDLVDLCTVYNISRTGNKAALIERIIAYYATEEKKQQELRKRMDYGAMIRDDEFERVIKLFQQWCDENGFHPSKLDESGVSYELVPLYEIRAAFADYDPSTSLLRNDKLVPTPGTKLEVFLEMLFNQRDEWEIFDSTDQDREFDVDAEFSDRWLVEGMKKLFDEYTSPPAQQQWCATSYANRD